MDTVTLLEAQQHLPQLVRNLALEAELVITDADKPVARLSLVTPQTSAGNLEPKSVGAMLKPFPSADDDTLGEILDARK